MIALKVLCVQIFANGALFDYGVTLSDAVDMPVNLGMQFVPRGRYMNAIGFLNDVIAIYPFNETFIAGQVCFSFPTHDEANFSRPTCLLHEVLLHCA